MKFSDTLLDQLFKLDMEYLRLGKFLTRIDIKNALDVSENSAKALRLIIENKGGLKNALLKVDNRDFKCNGVVELAMSDLHIPYHDKNAIDKIINFSKKRKVNTITLLGDIIDFYQCSVFTKNPEKKDVSREVDDAKDFLKYLRDEFPSAKIYYYLGNHEERLEKYIMQSADKIYGLVKNLLPERLGLEKMNIELKHNVFQIGKLWHMHGHEKPKGGGNPEHVCNVVWKYVHDHVICGHFHRSQSKIFSHISKVKWYNVFVLGWIGLPEAADYSKINNYNQGFALIEYDEKGNFSADNKMIINGDIY